MFENIPKEEKEKLTMYVIIAYCVLFIAILTYYNFFHFKPNFFSTAMTFILYSPFIITIYKLVKALKNK